MNDITTTHGQCGLPRYFATMFAMLAGLKQGAVRFTLPDGRVFRADGQMAGDVGEIIVRRGSMFARIARDGQLGVSESYMDGDWDSPDLMALLDVLMPSNEAFAGQMRGAGLVRSYERLRHWLRNNSRAQAQRNIAHHYDLGNAFYSQWLDDSMTYSSALFEKPEDSLADAQRAKYAAICDGLNLRQGDSVLEIGCGWGGFAEYAARERGARITGLTISRAQHDFAAARMQRLGLNDRVEIVLRDYRDQRGQYDGIASIEMFEAVGETYWPAYFDTLKARLKSGARAALQIITIRDDLFDHYRKHVDFIQKYVFPGGMLPSPQALAEHTARAGLQAVKSFDFAPSYSRTLRLWMAEFNAKWDGIRQLGFDERFQRMWNFYLASCAAGFAGRQIGVVQNTYQRV
ncbi:MAG: cyclopropane-fatty-acyl-phospholipid synthase family protein [Paracoccaceae bacterium]